MRDCSDKRDFSVCIRVVAWWSELFFQRRGKKDHDRYTHGDCYDHLHVPHDLRRVLYHYDGDVLDHDHLPDQQDVHG